MAALWYGSQCSGVCKVSNPCRLNEGRYMLRVNKKVQAMKIVMSHVQVAWQAGVA